MLQITNGIAYTLNQGFCCNFCRLKCSQFFKRRRTFLKFPAICLVVKL